MTPFPINGTSATASDVLLRAPNNERAHPAPPAEGAVSAAPATITEQAPSAAGEVQPRRKELDKAVEAVNEFVGAVNTDLRFAVDDESGRTVVKVIDVNTKEVIKQYPSEEMLAIAKALDSIKGLLVQQKA